MATEIRLLLCQLLGSGESPDDGTRWVKFKTQSGGIVVFWGGPDLGFVNVNMLQHQQTPLLIELNDPELCMPDAIVKQRYNCQYSVSEECLVTVYPVIGDA